MLANLNEKGVSNEANTLFWFMMVSPTCFRFVPVPTGVDGGEGGVGDVGTGLGVGGMELILTH